jgi:hypothetical protein
MHLEPAVLPHPRYLRHRTRCDRHSCLSPTTRAGRNACSTLGRTPTTTSGRSTAFRPLAMLVARAPPVVKKRSNHEGGLTLLHPSGYDFLDRSCAQIHPSFRWIKSGQRSNVLPQKWLAQHGMVAAQYAGSVLNGQSPEVPDSLSDLKVESRMGLVSFGMLVGPFYSFGS